MTGGPTDVPDAPGPDVLPALPGRRPAYTEFDRETGTDPAGWTPPEATVTAARFEGVAVELLELGARAGESPRGFVAGVDRWRSIDDHDHVLPVVGWGKQPRPWVAVPAGTTLADRTGAVELPEALWTGLCLADALVYAHGEGVVHGGVSPAVVHTHLTPGWAYPRLGGFGVAGPLEGESGYRAPEQVTPERFGPVTPLTDVYGLGVTLYELLTGELPHGTGGIGSGPPVPPSTIEPTLPNTVDDLLRGALSVSPADRYDDASAFRDRIVELFEAEHGGRTGATDDAPARFPLFDGDRAEWRAPCPDCGRSVTNTVGSFVAHWTETDRCDGPNERVPDRATCSAEEWAAVVARARAVEPPADRPTPDRGEHPLWRALATERVVRVGGVLVASRDGSYPWLSYPRRGWRVPCPACGSPVYNSRSAMKAHWSDAPSCVGPPDDYDTA